VSPKHRKIVLFCSLAGLLLITFGIYATTQGPPPDVEAVVYFSPTATVAQKEAVRTACPTVGNAVQQPPDTSGLATSRTYPLRYDISKATSADRAALFKCIHAQRGVIGISEYTQGQ
jgi:hypothetical protein